MSHKMNGGRDWDWGSGPGGGLGTKQGQIAGPNEGMGYDIKAAPGPGIETGGCGIGPFGTYKESPTIMPTVSAVSVGENMGTDGGLETPMSTSPAMLMGSGGSSGSGSQSGGIASPLQTPFGDRVGK